MVVVRVFWGALSTLQSLGGAEALGLVINATKTLSR